MKEKLREKIVLGTEGMELTDKRAMSKISVHEMYRHSNAKRCEQVRQAGVQRRAQGGSRSRDPSRDTPRGPPKKGCWHYDEGDLHQNKCITEVLYDTCQILNHSNTMFWKKECNARRSKTQYRDRGKTNKKKSKKVCQASKDALLIRRRI